MTAALVAYDRPVVNLIAAVAATGHVTHTNYRKTSVTLHHNAGINSLEQVASTWKTREASTQFGVDKSARVGQFTGVTEYAWACGNTEGNMRSIHIEMSNDTYGPTWHVSDATWNAAARLAGWLFAKVIGQRPASGNFFYHHHWYNTACAGPYMDSIYSQVLAAAQAAYDAFTGPHLRQPWPSYMGAGDYFGLYTGPEQSHGGTYATERPAVTLIQQRVTKLGYPVTVDGWFGAGTKAAVAAWQHAHAPGTTLFGQVWPDDWHKLFTY